MIVLRELKEKDAPFMLEWMLIAHSFFQDIQPDIIFHLARKNSFSILFEQKIKNKYIFQ